MAKIALEGSTDTEGAVKLKAALERGVNSSRKGQASPTRPFQYNVHLFTVSRRSFVVTHALLPHVDIPACEPGQRYRHVRYIPHPFPQKVEDVYGIRQEDYDYYDGERVAQDICDPMNPTLNQGFENYGKIDPFYAVQDGTNLSRHGVFWSLNEVPTEKELSGAERKRDTYFRALIQKADQSYAKDPRVTFGEDERMALDH